MVTTYRNWVYQPPSHRNDERLARKFTFRIGYREYSYWIFYYFSHRVKCKWYYIYVPGFPENNGFQWKCSSHQHPDYNAMAKWWAWDWENDNYDGPFDQKFPEPNLNNPPEPGDPANIAPADFEIGDEPQQPR